MEVGHNQEVGLQYVGTYLGCEEVAKMYEPASALIISNTRMTLRWAFVETGVNLPLPAALSLPDPLSCPDS